MGGKDRRVIPTKEQLVNLYWGQKMSFVMIAERLGYTKTGVRDMFKRFSIPSRNLSEAQQVGGQAGRCRYRGGYQYINGYKLIKDKSHHRANGRGYVFEHIIVLEEKLGRCLLPDEVGHHLNGIKFDNRPENLIPMPKRKHSPKLIETALKKRIRELEGRFADYESHPN